MLKLKTRILKFANFGCMIVLLGLQTLLQGRWSIPETVPVENSKNNSKNP